ncbi:MAG: GMC family oxidoreductase [Thermoleophilaceae bacterium]|nr:GMC family oxidoreductase [Thermoleophilaceae bacterium]
MSDEHYDVIIIGTGAGGGTLAHRLAPSGKRILLLERGGYLPREPENWDSREVFGRERYVTSDEWVDKNGVRFRPHAQYFVGGNTKFYGAILFRLRERDFEEVQHYGGVSPAWPISYADLEPYYAEAERLYLVHGKAGEDHTEPPRSGEFPYPPVSHEPRIQQLADDFERTGHHPFHLPVGVDLDESDAEAGRCVRCDRFDGFPCLTDGKADAHVLCVRPALKHENVTLRTHAKVVRLETGTSGRSVSRVVVDRGGQEETYSGDIVVVSCGAAESPALLLRSANDRHPNGLANSSDQVGRNYMAHINSGVVAISQTPNETKFQKTLGVNDYYWGAEDSELPLGHIQMLGKSDKNILRAGAPWFAPGFALDYMAKHAIDFWLTTEDLPYPDNRITVDRQGTIHLSKTFHNEEPHRRLLGKLKSLLGDLGCHERSIPRFSVLDQRIPLAGIAHQCGTTRFGSDPKESVLDVNCRAHELDNLYVVDTSFFPSSSAVNPALTAMANALRVGDHLLERLEARVEAGERRDGRLERAQTQTLHPHMTEPEEATR